jgi:type I restriction enzyme M protein
MLMNPFSAEGQQALGKVSIARAVVVPKWGLKHEAIDAPTFSPSRFGIQSSEALGIEFVMTHVKQLAVVMVPNRILFARGSERALRRQLVEEGRVAGVIGFPGGLLRNTTVPFNLVLVGPQSRRRIVRFYDVSSGAHVTGRGKLRVHRRHFLGSKTILDAFGEEPSKASQCLATSTKELIAAQDYVLVPTRYMRAGISTHSISTERALVTTLGEIVEVVKPQFLPSVESANEGIEVSEVSPGDVPEFGYLETGPRSRFVGRSSLESRSKQVLQPNDVLVSAKGTIGKVGIVGQPKSKTPLLASQSLLILRIRDDAAVDPRYLAMYLRSPAVGRLLESLAVGVTIPNVSLPDMKALPISVPNSDQQRSLVEAFDKLADLQNRLTTLQTKQRSLDADIWKAAGLDVQVGNAK